jgi:hypothetical protein
MSEMDDNIPKRRWFQFSLRTFFFFVTALCLVVGWFAHQRNWIRQRHAFTEEVHRRGPWRGEDPFMWYEAPDSEHTFDVLHAANNRKAPWSLRILGEQSRSAIILLYDQKEDNGERLVEIWKEIDYAQSLFPEADIYPICPGSSGRDTFAPKARTVESRPSP